jgi:hypothetical protein
MLPWLLAASPAVALILAALIVVVVGIRHEPSTVELRSQPPSRLAALVRRLLGVSVRRPDPNVTDDESLESCFVGHSAWPDRR